MEGKKYMVWRVWLKLNDGGILGLPYPAQSEEQAQSLARDAGRCFDGDVMWVQYMGEYVAEIGPEKPQDAINYDKTNNTPAR